MLRVLMTAVLLCSLGAAAEPRELDWLDLLTDADREAMLNLPPIDHSDPFDLDGLAAQVEDAVAQARNQAIEDVLTSNRVRPELDKTEVRIPGFVVPLEMNDEGAITEFFLVPYFGACIHVPPPPPNQIIHVSYPKGFHTQVIYDPFWIEGILSTEAMENEIAEAAYTLKAGSVTKYVY